MNSSNDNAAKNNPWPIDPTKTELTPEELAAVYARLKAECMPPTEEEIIRLVEESHYNFEDTLKMLDEAGALVEGEHP